MLKQRLHHLADRTERQVAELWRRREARLIDEETFVVLAAVVLARARAAGVLLADVSVAAKAAAALGEMPDPVGLLPPDNDVDRLESSVRSVLTQDIETAATLEALSTSRALRFARLARDAPADAVRWGMSKAMENKGAGWVRVTDPNPCPVCLGLADGVVRSPLVLMKRHTGCMCVPEPVFGRE